MNVRSRSLATAAVLSSILSLSCAGDGSGVPLLGNNGAPFPARLSSIQANLFSPTCAPGCHEPGGTAPFSMRTRAESYANLVGVPNGENALDPMGAVFLRVEPGAPDRSYLILKLRGDPAIVGERMPAGQGPLDDDVISAVASWIADGAIND